MKIYQIGGAVRDRLLGKAPLDFDYVVVGSTSEKMIEMGFQPIGKNFPVFLHPETKEEYALARKEIKIGTKHTDFKFVFDKSVTLKEDVLRRDFTMNAVAIDVETGEVIDYVDGQKDIQKKLIRHIHADHFKEDPLRVLRMCRFSAQLHFEIDELTMDLAKKMVASDMLKHLSRERVFKEFEKALYTDGFDLFIKNMRECGALEKILPEISSLFSVPEKEEYHPEKNSGEHTLLSLKIARNYDPIVKFAVLMHDVGKILTPKIILPSHYGHDMNGVELIKGICFRLRVPKKYEKMALIAAEYHMLARKASVMSVSELYDFVLRVTNNFKTKKNLENLFSVCQADLLGRGLPLEQREFDNFEFARLRSFMLFDEVKNIKPKQMPGFDEEVKNKDFKLKLDSYRLNILTTKKI